MKKLASILILVTATANAATTNLTVSGTISTTCSFGTPTGGIFGYDPSTPSVLSTGSNGGSPATVAISYVGTPTVTVTEPTAFTSTPAGYSGSPAFSSIVNSNNGGTLSYVSNLASYTQTGGSSDLIILNVAANNNGGTAFPIGTYNLSSTITCN